MKNKGYILNQKGIALALTIMVLMVLMIIFGSVMTLLGSNTRQVKHQENIMRAHYVALTGINMASTALFIVAEVSPGNSVTLMDQHFKGNLPITPLVETITLPTGEAEVTMTAENVSGERWIRIESIGTLSDTGTTRTLVLRINADIPAIQEWGRN